MPMVSLRAALRDDVATRVNRFDTARAAGGQGEFLNRQATFSATTPATTAPTPSQRRGVRCSFSSRAPISVANSTEVSRSEATRATGALVMAQTEIA